MASPNLRDLKAPSYSKTLRIAIQSVSKENRQPGARRQENPISTQALEDEDELSKAELYQSVPASLETESELERYIGQERLSRETNID